jgi:rare lipoprotein A
MSYGLRSSCPTARGAASRQGSACERGPAAGRASIEHRAAEETLVTFFPPQHRIAAFAILFALGLCAAPDAGAGPAKSEHRAAAGNKLDRSGQERVGKASFYARKFAGRKMANGKPMNPHRDIAASKTLPLGTTAKVTNLETGRSAIVTIEDRGPYVHGRIVDLSPAAAQKIGLDRETGVAAVAVAPIEVPLADGTVKPGDGAAAR